ncbi:branched-chain amino acid ABC transporter permease (plasmid) [Halorarum halophilum]|uniref:Branched-chain amino acid ABC transporter permease n=1 Tax=Halorarum halophilum TaxID=2743090 RepID=A0A7D5KVY2_9EURY|nr:branched-chain amino acid ABC transporter permease [Halobaculum halophilum]QLG29620.1 branched-chain amino acid ABC transporter permease [Halobaculum halophilum]
MIGNPFAGSDLFADRRRVAALVFGVLALAVVPFTTTAYVTEIVFTGLVFVMLGVSWNLLAGYAGQISLGHAAFFGIGAYVAAWLTTPTRAGLPEAIQTPVLLALVGGGLVAALVALAVGPIMFRLTGHYFAIGTLALAAIIQLVLLDQRQFSGGSSGYFIQGGIGEDLMFLVAVAATVGMVASTYLIVNSRLGLGMRAIHGGEGAASSLGVNPLKYKMYAFVISSFMAGLTGAIYAMFTLYVNPESTLNVVWMIDTLVVVILGGMGTMLGPIVGAALFLVLDNGLRAVAGEFATTIEGLLIILFMIYAPSGLYGLIKDRYLGGEESETAEPEAEGA